MKKRQSMGLRRDEARREGENELLDHVPRMTAPLQVLLVRIESINESSSTVLKSERISVVVVHLRRGEKEERQFFSLIARSRNRTGRPSELTSVKRKLASE